MKKLYAITLAVTVLSSSFVQANQPAQKMPVKKAVKYACKHRKVDYYPNLGKLAGYMSSTIAPPALGIVGACFLHLGRQSDNLLAKLIGVSSIGVSVITMPFIIPSIAYTKRLYKKMRSNKPCKLCRKQQSGIMVGKPAVKKA